MTEPYLETLRKKREALAEQRARQRAEYEATLERLRGQFDERATETLEPIESND